MDEAKASCLREGAIVRLTGLVNATALNGAEGIICSAPQGDPPRLRVKLQDPALAADYPKGLLVKPENLEPAAAAERLPKSKSAQSPGSQPPSLSAQEKPAGKAASKARQQQQQQGGKAEEGDKARKDGGGGRRPGAPVSAQRRAMVFKCVEPFVRALEADLYPEKALESLFGVQMEPQDGKIPGDFTTWPIGNLVYGAWITIRLRFYEDRMEEMPQSGWGLMGLSTQEVEALRQQFKEWLAEPILEGRLPEWYEEQLLRLQREGRSSMYSHEIVRRGFRGIVYDTGLLRKLSVPW